MDEETKVGELMIKKTEDGEIEWNVTNSDSPRWNSNFDKCYFEVQSHYIILVSPGRTATINDATLIKRLEKVLSAKYPPEMLTRKQELQVFIDCLEKDSN